MRDVDLRQYCDRITEGRRAEARVIHPGSVITAHWVRLKCQFGCTRYGKGYCCPPDTPTPDEMKKVLSSYQRAILFHLELARIPGESRKKNFVSFVEALVSLEGEMFKSGYYKALAILAGPCELCEECSKPKGEPCRFGQRARPSMEACGIDVYATARGNGFPVQPLREKGETQNDYCLLLVD